VKFVNSPYYESELCGGAVTVSFSKYLPSDALFTTLHPLLENVLQTVDHFEISCLGAPFSWLEKPRYRMGRDLDCMADVLMGFHRSTFSKQNTELSLITLYWCIHCNVTTGISVTFPYSVQTSAPSTATWCIWVGR
jgi:hypothetical protein